MAAPVFKLPDAFLDLHKVTLEAWDWARKPELRLAVWIPGGGFADDDKLEAIGRGHQLIVRCKSAGAMKRMRAYAETLPGYATPTPDEEAAILKARNPENPD